MYDVSKSSPATYPPTPCVLKSRISDKDIIDYTNDNDDKYDSYIVRNWQLAWQLSYTYVAWERARGSTLSEAQVLPYGHTRAIVRTKFSLGVVAEVLALSVHTGTLL